MNYKFSVLISVYFKEVPEYLDLSLKSITDDQILKPDEIVLVKDGPLTEALDSVIQKYVNKYKGLFKIIALDKNQGLGKALNIGLEKCTYELVARMDGDDISKPERFLKQIEIYKNNPKLDMIGSWIDEFQIINNEFKVRSIRKVPEKNEEIYKKLKTICTFNHPTVMYKKIKVIGVGSYNQEFKLEDYYLWIRMALNKNIFFNLQESLVYFRITNDTSKRRGGIKLTLDDIKFQNKLLENRFIFKFEYFRNVIYRIVYRTLPSKVRGFFQQKIFRKEIRK
ncbi:MAG: glycosyltransferase [Fusobacteriaceae bacterium]